MIINRELEGAWEEPGVIGTRVEIEGNLLTVFWMGGEVLKTKFTVEEKEGALILEPKEKGLRYKGAFTDYASLKSLTLKEGKLELVKVFPISGEGVEILKKTENNRYGNYDICNEVLKELQGSWKSEDGSTELVFSKNTMSLFGMKRKVCVLKSRYSGSSPYLIADEDPSVKEMGGFTRFEYSGGVIRTSLMVCDAPPIFMVFKKA